MDEVGICRDPRDEAARVHCLTTRLRNMSCPPRTRVAVRPLRPPEPVSAAGPPVAASAAAAAGLRLVARVSVDHLIRRWFPAFRVSAANADLVFWSDRKRLRGQAAGTDNLRLRCLVVLSRAAVGDVGPVTRRPVNALAGVPTESLEAAYIENTRRLDPGACGLPAFGLVQADDNAHGGATPLDVEPARALALLSRTAGTVFSAARNPVLPNHSGYRPPLALFAFAPAAGRSAP